MTELSPMIQHAMTDFQAASQLPWWASIASATIVVRSVTFPLVRQQVLVSRKLAAAMPEINFLAQLLRTRLQQSQGTSISEQLQIVGVFFKGVKACLILHEVRLLEMIFYPLLNMSIFITFVFSVREMVQSSNIIEDIETGGLFWFQDLSERDKTFVLPLIATSLSYYAIEYATATQQGRIIVMFKDVLQCIIILSLPVVTQLPGGVFCYWIPSSCFGLAQSMVLRSPYFQKLLRIPRLPLKKG